VCVFELLVKLLSRRRIVEALARRGKSCKDDRHGDSNFEVYNIR
jgi:hypothetical protein